MRAARRGALVGIVALVATSCRTGPSGPSVADCASFWNSSSNRANQEAVSGSGFRTAILSSVDNKAGQHGCGAMFIQQSGGKWSLFADIVGDDTATLTWPDRVSGNQWGIDSPDGAASDPNYVVTQAGEVREMDA